MELEPAGSSAALALFGAALIELYFLLLITIWCLHSLSVVSIFNLEAAAPPPAAACESAKLPNPGLFGTRCAGLQIFTLGG